MSLLPIAMDWQSIHVTTNNTRVVMFRDAPNRWGVVVFEPDDTTHQLPILNTEHDARQAQWEVINQLPV